MKKIEFELKRIYHDDQSTIGILFIDGLRECFILEDQPQKKKIKNHTRIPAGRYRITTEIPSSEDDKYRSRLESWGMDYIGMPRLLDVPEFRGILIHMGNDDDDTSGCLLTGTWAGMLNGKNYVTQSGDSYKALYKKITEYVRAGKEIYITVKDEL